MQTIIKTKNVSLTDAMQTYITEKLLTRVRRLVEHTDMFASTLIIEAGKDSRRHKKGAIWLAEATMQWGKEVLRLEASGESFQEAVDLLENEIVREITKFKGKRSALDRRNARVAKKNATIAKAARFYRKGRIREEGI